MGNFRIARVLVVAVACGLMLASQGTSASAADRASSDGAGWGIRSSTGAVTPSAPFQCFGFFVGPQLERDTVASYIFFGGRQQCTIIVSHTVEVYLDRKIGSDWVAVARVFRTGVGNILQATGDSGYCSDSGANSYRLEVFATANGVNATPWPATSGSVTLNCRLIAI
jgi:hypothetical protein